MVQYYVDKRALICMFCEFNIGILCAKHGRKLFFPAFSRGFIYNMLGLLGTVPHCHMSMARLLKPCMSRGLRHMQVFIGLIRREATNLRSLSLPYCLMSNSHSLLHVWNPPSIPASNTTSVPFSAIVPFRFLTILGATASARDMLTVEI